MIKVLASNKTYGSYKKIKYIEAPDDMIFLGIENIKSFLFNECKHLKKEYRIIFKCINGIDMFKWDGKEFSDTTQEEYEEAMHIKKILF